MLPSLSRSCTQSNQRTTNFSTQTSYDSTSTKKATVVYMGAQKCYITVDGGRYNPVLAYVSSQVLSKDGEDKIVVGDQVLAREIHLQSPDSNIHSSSSSHGPSLCVVERLPRRNVLRRSDAHERCRLLAANLDLLIVVACFGTPPFSSLIVDRVLVAAAAAGIPAALVLNKLDLDDAGRFPMLAETYRRAGYTVIGTCAHADPPTGLDELRASCRVCLMTS